MSTTDKTEFSDIDMLAVEGGTAAVSQPLPAMYPGAMRIAHEEEEAVLEVLRSKCLFRYEGPGMPTQVNRLEEAFATYMGIPHCVAVASGTAALMCALIGLGIGPGDEVIVPAYTWIATASSVVAIGAIPVIADVDESLMLDSGDVERKVSSRTRAIIPVHMNGSPCRMDELKHLAQMYDLSLLEDTAQAIGGSYQGQKLGTIGNAGAFSLQLNKIITSGEGGLVITADPLIAQRAAIYMDIVNNLRFNLPVEQTLTGVNFRMTELQGAIARVQLQRLDGLLKDMRERKAQIKARISDIAQQKGITFRTIHDVEGDTSTTVIFFLPTAEQAEQVGRALHYEGVGAWHLFDPNTPDYHCYYHWAPILQKQTWSVHGGPWRWHGEEVNYSLDMCPRALDLLGRAIHLDVSPELTERNIEEMTHAIHKVLSRL